MQKELAMYIDIVAIHPRCRRGLSLVCRLSSDVRLGEAATGSPYRCMSMRLQRWSGDVQATSQPRYRYALLDDGCHEDRFELK